MRGLSPLARGNLAQRFEAAKTGGPIPARTGQPHETILLIFSYGAYPRSHGATVRSVLLSPSLGGLSPLARGNRRKVITNLPLNGPIPARTGQPAPAGQQRTSYWAYPRSHGATALTCPASKTKSGLSPLARGNRCVAGSTRQAVGPIPARTGQPGMHQQRAPKIGAYPRSHGATAIP